MKLNPLREVIHGKRLIVVDDSIVRGNTQRALVRMLREAGAVEVHVRISSPPVRWPCFFGIDFASRAELIANGVDIDGICRSIGADSLGYISEAGMVAATRQDSSELCLACFTGEYPMDLDESQLGKEILENAVAATPSGVPIPADPADPADPVEHGFLPGNPDASATPPARPVVPAGGVL